LKVLRALVVGALCALATVLPAKAQQVVPNQLSGNECWNAGQGPGGPSAFVCSFQVRNSTGYQLVNAATSGTFSPTSLVNQFLIAVQPNGTMTINTPTVPFDAELFSVCNVSNAAFAAQTITLANSAGQTFATGLTTTLTTLAARTCVEIQYSLSNTTWYQIR
jgi:hypothetical protein